MWKVNYLTRLLIITILFNKNIFTIRLFLIYENFVLNSFFFAKTYTIFKKKKKNNSCLNSFLSIDLNLDLNRARNVECDVWKKFLSIYRIESSYVCVASPIEFKKLPRRQGDQSNSLFESLFFPYFFPTRSLSKYQEWLNTGMPASDLPSLLAILFLFFLSSPFLIPQQVVTLTENGESKGRERWIATLKTLRCTRSLESHLIPRKHLPPPPPPSLSLPPTPLPLCLDRKLTAFIQRKLMPSMWTRFLVFMQLPPRLGIETRNFLHSCEK